MTTVKLFIYSFTILFIFPFAILGTRTGKLNIHRKTDQPQQMVIRIDKFIVFAFYNY